MLTQPNTTTHSRLAVLIVDEDPSMRSLLIQLCQSLGCRAEGVTAGHLLMGLADSTPDVVMLDDATAELGLTRTVSQIRSNPWLSRLKLVLMTSGAAGDGQVGTGAGIDFTLRKPFSLADLDALFARAEADLPTN